MRLLLMTALALTVACSPAGHAPGAAAPPANGATMTHPDRTGGLALTAPETRTQGRLTVSSTAFGDGGAVPHAYSGYGGGRSPPLRWSGGPPNSTSYVLIVEDPDAPMARPFVHWVVYDIPAEAAIPEGGTPAGAVEGDNTIMKAGYFPLMPPPGPAHHYHFQVFALDGPLGLKAGASRDQVVSAMAGHVLASGELVGLYRKP